MNLGKVLLSGILLTLPLSCFAVTGSDFAATPTRIEVAADRWDFNPFVITVKRGEPVTLVVRASEVAQSLVVKHLKFAAEIPKDSTSEITFNPDTKGSFEARCTRLSGTGHVSMRLIVRVVE